MSLAALTSRLLLAPPALLLALAGCVTEPVSAACEVRDLGPFSMCVPADWRLTQAGTDSAAGTFEADGLSVRYDFGLYSDSLETPPGVTDSKDSAVSIDGMPGRKVGYALRDQRFFGIHLPKIKMTTLGPVKLTILAQGRNTQRVQEAAVALMTVHIKP